MLRGILAARGSVLSAVGPRTARRAMSTSGQTNAEAAPLATSIDRAKFDRTMRLKALRVPARRCQEYLKKLHGFTFNQPKTKCIYSDPGSKETRLLLLSEDLKETGIEGLPEALRSELQESELETTHHELTLGYEQLATDVVLKDLLPEGSEVPSSFETVGHIAHLNIRDELLPYKHVIGQVILDKNPNIRTVVNKVGSISNEYRVFEMEVVAGKQEMETEVKQFKAVFRLNFSEVYWNSRLESEHKRLVDMFAQSDIIVDMMCGIGPFAIPAAQKGCTVLGNDLNPKSFHYLKINIKKNKVAKNVTAFNMCGREFVRMLLRAHNAVASKPGGAPEGFVLPKDGVIFHHAVMNLPASAVKFLDAFNGAFDPEVWEGRQLPMVHCYTFARSHETDADIQATCEKFLGGYMDSKPSIHNVRNVAPGKNMMCVSFRVPVAVAFAGRTNSEGGDGGEEGKHQPSGAPKRDNVGTVDGEGDGEVKKKPRSD